MQLTIAIYNFILYNTSIKQQFRLQQFRSSDLYEISDVSAFSRINTAVVNEMALYVYGWKILNRLCCSYSWVLLQEVTYWADNTSSRRIVFRWSMSTTLESSSIHVRLITWRHNAWGPLRLRATSHAGSGTHTPCGKTTATLDPAAIPKAIDIIEIVYFELLQAREYIVLWENEFILVQKTTLSVKNYYRLNSACKADVILLFIFGTAALLPRTILWGMFLSSINIMKLSSCLCW